MTHSSPFAVAAFGAILFLGGCAAPGAVTDESGTTGSDAPAPDSGSSGADFTADDVGTGTITIEGVGYVGFEGDCEIYKDYGAAVVDDPQGEDVGLTLGVDNIDSGEDPQLGLTAVGLENFRLLGHSASGGTFTDISFVGPRTEGASSDLALVAFTGTTDDGQALEAELVCTIDKP